MMAQGEQVDPGGPRRDSMDTDQPATSKDTKPNHTAEELKLDLDTLDEGKENGLGHEFVTRGEIDDAARRIAGSGSIDGGSTIRLDDLDSEDLPPPEMTPEEKQAMVDCVRRGDIEEFEELLDIPGAEINMVWFSENLLMTAVRWKREEMAMYLIDNGVNVLFETTRLQKYEDPNDPKKVVLRVYTVSCRQIAYDNNLQDVVDAIDLESGEDVMHTVTERTKKLWKPKEVRDFEKLRATHEVLSDLSSITAVDLLWEDDGAMADTEVTNSTVNSPRERPQTPSDKTASLVSEKGLVVDTRVMMDVQPGETGIRMSVGDRNRPSLPNVSGDVLGDPGEDRAHRKISTDSLRHRPAPKVVVEGEEGSLVALKTVKEEGADDTNAQASGDNDLLPCHSRGACTDDGVYGKRSPFSAATVQSRVKSAGFARIGGTRTDMYRKRDSKRKIMLREQDQNGADYAKPVMVNGSYPFESKRWSVEDGHKTPSQTPQECVAPIGSRQTLPKSPRGHHTSEVFIKPRPAFVTSGHHSSRYTNNHDSWDSFPSIGAKTTRLQHKQTYLIDVGGRNIRDKNK
ncbi:uncharacterized protein LOC135494626 isoform X2 [Lineus longissimus]